MSENSFEERERGQEQEEKEEEKPSPRRPLKKTSLREIASKKQQASAVWAKPTWIRRGFLEAEKRVIELGAAGTLMENLEGSLFLKELT